MGKVIKKRIQGMNWWAKTSLVLILTLVASVFMYEGWYKPKPAAALISAAQPFTEVYNDTVYPSTLSYTVNPGSYRMLVVAISTSITSSATQTVGTVSFGGIPMTAGATENSSNRQKTYIYYLQESTSGAAAVMNGSPQNLVIGISGGTVNSSTVYAAVYTGVDQSASPITNSQTYNGGTGNATSAQFTTGLTISSNDQAVIVYTNLNWSSPTTIPGVITYPTSWLEDLTSTTSGTSYAVRASVGDRTLQTSTTDVCSTNFTTSARRSMSAMSMKAAVIVDSTPPVPGAVSVNPDIASSYTSPTPTITTTFTDAESAVTSCQYTTNGTTWSAGVVSGSGPYTCTASPAGLTGALTINMRATSTGGIGTASAISRTVDTSVPTDGTLTVTSGNLQNNLSWSAAIDAGSGISTYILRYATGATAPASCAVGTAVPGSPFSGATISTTHTGLTNGTQYSYRLCATDNIGNTSAGTTGSATPAAVTATITSCGGCHGYKTVFTDGASRNAGGLFQGSHNKHVITQAINCSSCHVVPATENSTSFGHSNGTVTMASPLSGGSYSFGSRAVSNTFNPGTCSGTSCHAAVYATTSGTSPSWGTPGGGCGACHVNSPTVGSFQANGAPNTGGHNIHMTAGAVCANCHAGAVTAVTGGTRHGNGFINLTTGYNSPTRNQATKRASGGTYYTCSAASCHANPYAANSVTTNVWSPTSTGCGGCHKNDATNANLGAFTAYSSPATVVGPKTGNHVDHLNYARYICGDCHSGAVSNSTGGAFHGNGVVNVIQYAGTITKHQTPFTYLTNGCAIDCHIQATWGTQLGCIDCHNTTITRRKGRPGTTLANVVDEMNGGTQVWSHKRTAGYAVTNSDCIVCHLEGRMSTGKSTKLHADGNIDLRDHATATADQRVTDLAGASFAFARFSTSYATGSRASTISNTSIDNVVTRKFCLGCHKSGGSSNVTAGQGGIATGGTSLKPFGSAGGTALNINTQFATTNSSKHPIFGPLNKDFPTQARLNAPYNGFTRVGTSGTLANGVVMNCFDCHNVVGTPLTLRTVAAHGNAVTIRGTSTVSGTPSSANYPTLCRVCHAGYESSTSTNGHTAGSALGTGLNAASGMTAYLAYGCNVCHASAYTGVVRPVRGEDVHGVNVLPTGGGTSTGRWSTGTDKRPYAFIRNTKDLGTHQPKKIGATSYTPQCEMGPSGASGPTCSNQGTKSYSPGGTY